MFAVSTLYGLITSGLVKLCREFVKLTSVVMLHNDMLSKRNIKLTNVNVWRLGSLG